MTNYEKLFQDQMKDPQFANAYLDARLERLVMEFLENLKERISQNEPKETLLRTINSMQDRIYSLQF
jgi:regulator of sirC expression with transglutaminase-like and TPR domain